MRTDLEGVAQAAQRLIWIAQLDPTPEVEALLVHAPSGIPLGFMCLTGLDPANAKAEFLMGLFRGRGSRPAAEAVHWAFERAFGVMAIEKLVFHVMAGNLPALALLANLQVPQECVLRRELAGPEGARVDLHRFALFADDWKRSDLRRRLQRVAPLAD